MNPKVELFNYMKKFPYVNCIYDKNILKKYTEQDVMLLRCCFNSIEKMQEIYNKYDTGFKMIYIRIDDISDIYKIRVSPPVPFEIRFHDDFFNIGRWIPSGDCYDLVDLRVILLGSYRQLERFDKISTKHYKDTEEEYQKAQLTISVAKGLDKNRRKM